MLRTRVGDRQVLRRRSWWLPALLVITGCSAFSLAGLTGGSQGDAGVDAQADVTSETAGPDAGGGLDAGEAAVTTDAPTSSDGVADGVAPADVTEEPGGIDLLAGAGEFEDGDGGSGCGPAFDGPFNATLTLTTIAHSGQYACLVCASSGAAGVGYTIDGDGFGEDAGQTYTATAWILQAPGNAPDYVQNHVRIFENDTLAQVSDSASVLTTTTWQQISAGPLTTTESGGTANTYVGTGPDNVGGCFIVDDITLVLH